MPTFDLATGLLWYFIFVYSTVFHEAAHAWSAMRLGDDTAYRGGQVSLDPTPHIRREPFGLILVPILSFILNKGTWMMGWASAPYNPEWALRYPRRSAWMAMAGPAANLIIVIVSGILIRLGVESGIFNAPTSFSFAHVVDAASPNKGTELLALGLGIAFSLNLLLAIFNLLPVPPLDGSAIPLLFLKGAAAENYQRILWQPAMQFIGIILVFRGVGWLVMPVLTWAVNLMYSGIAVYR